MIGAQVPLSNLTSVSLLQPCGEYAVVVAVLVVVVLVDVELVDVVRVADVIKVVIGIVTVETVILSVKVEASDVVPVSLSVVLLVDAVEFDIIVLADTNVADEEPCALLVEEIIGWTVPLELIPKDEGTPRVLVDNPIGSEVSVRTFVDAIDSEVPTFSTVPDEDVCAVLIEDGIGGVLALDVMVVDDTCPSLLDDPIG